MVDFSGWSMPVQYHSIVEEHQATRTRAGLFDVSHMGRLRFSGAGAGAFLDRLVTRRVDNLAAGKIRYALIVNESGGVLDDVLVYRLADPTGTPYFAMVVNAGNRQKIMAWIDSQLSGFDAAYVDETPTTAMLAVQGPHAIEMVDPLLAAPLAKLGYYTGIWTEILGAPCVLSRTGYTGEDGCEITVAADAAENVWTEILKRGASLGAKAAGLGARDTLRLEAAMPLYGHELTEQIDPYQAGLGFAVNLTGREFVGREALQALKNRADAPRRVGLEMLGRRIPREHFPVQADGAVVGEITSGTFSPTLQKPIAMAYLPPALAHEGAEVEVQIRNRLEPARVVKLPFYSRS